MKKSKLPTIEDLKQYQQALREKFDSSESIAYPNVSMSQLSIARHYGGCKVNGQDWTYNAADDSLIRNDVIKFYIKLNKKKQTNDKEQTLVDLR